LLGAQDLVDFPANLWRLNAFEVLWGVLEKYMKLLHGLRPVFVETYVEQQQPEIIGLPHLLEIHSGKKLVAPLGVRGAYGAPDPFVTFHRI
jgi:hypothetical protein